MTIWQDNALRFASTDRAGAADLVLELAVAQALADIRAGAPELAHDALYVAAASADRILGRAS